MSHYATLDIAQDASAAEITAAYEALVAQYDPAQVAHAAPEIRELAAKRYAAITTAYAVLRDPAARIDYDASLAAPEPDTSFDYRPLAVPGAPKSRGWAGWSWMRGWMVALASLVSVAVATTWLVWQGTQPPVAQPAPETMPLFASVIVNEITDPAVRDQLLSLDAAVQQGRSAVQQDPRNITAWIYLGNAHYDFIQTIYETAPAGQAYSLNLNRWLDASEAYTRALQIDPQQPVVRSDYALALIRYGQGMQNPAYETDGLAQAELALAADDQTPQVLLNVGRAFALTGRRDEAERLWQRVSDLAPQTGLALQAERLRSGEISP